MFTLGTVEEAWLSFEEVRRLGLRLPSAKLFRKYAVLKGFCANCKGSVKPSWQGHNARYTRYQCWNCGIGFDITDVK